MKVAGPLFLALLRESCRLGIIRLLLALSVVIAHSSQGDLLGFQLVGGQAAVQAFYVISGFYMALVLNRKYADDLAGYKTFILARIFRLFPAYLFVLILSIGLAAAAIVPHPAYALWMKEAGNLSIGGWLLVGLTHLTLIGQDAVWFSGYDPASGSMFFSPNGIKTPAGTIPAMSFLFVGQAWTLGVELLFYLIAPFIVRRVPAIVALFIASWALRIVGYKLGYRDDPWGYRFFPFELAMFLLGSAAYHVYDWLGKSNKSVLNRLGWPALIGMLSIVLFLFFFAVPGRALVVSTAMGLSVPFIFALTKNNKVDRWIGELSYPVYLTHELVRLALLWWLPAHNSVGLFALVTLVVSILLMVGFEHPFESMRARFVARRNEKASAAASTSTIQ